MILSGSLMAGKGCYSTLSIPSHLDSHCVKGILSVTLLIFFSNELFQNVPVEERAPKPEYLPEQFLLTL